MPSNGMFASDLPRRIFSRSLSCLLMKVSVPSQRVGTTHPLLKLFQKPQIILVEQPDVVDAITDHGDALDAEAEGPAGPDFRIVTDVLEHLRMHHAAAGDLQPFLAHLPRERTGEIDLEARLGVAEVVRAETNLHVAAAKLPEHELDGALEIADGDAL